MTERALIPHAPPAPAQAIRDSERRQRRSCATASSPAYDVGHCFGNVALSSHLAAGERVPKRQSSTEGSAARSEAHDPTRKVGRVPSVSSSTKSNPVLQRKCACGCSAETNHEQAGKGLLSTSRGGPAGAEPAGLPPIVHEVLRTPGQQLDAGTRAFMEPRFGHDFGQVRVHTDARAARSADSVNAQAYTVGAHVVSGPAIPTQLGKGSELIATNCRTWCSKATRSSMRNCTSAPLEVPQNWRPRGSRTRW